MLRPAWHSRLSAGLALLLSLAPIAEGQIPGWARKAEHARPVNFENSSRIHDLIRSGNLYLSLSDALALAIENNLDIELQRFSIPVADTDVLRAKGGGTLRGVPFILAESPGGSRRAAEPAGYQSGERFERDAWNRCGHQPARTGSSGRGTNQSLGAGDHPAIERHPGHHLRSGAGRAIELDASNHAANQHAW